MKHTFLMLVVLLLTTSSFGQKKYFENKFEHYAFVDNKDTIKIHTYTNGKIASIKKVIFYIQGSGGNPFYHLIKHIDTLKTKNPKEKPTIRKYFEVRKTLPFSLEILPADYLLVMISKKGFPFEYLGKKLKVPISFYQNDNLNYRVWQASKAIDYVVDKLVAKPKKVIVLGHSEGSEVVAKLGVFHKKISHIGYFSGGGNAQYYDFLLDIRKQLHQGKISEEDAVSEAEKLFKEIKDIYQYPNSLDKKFLGHSYKKWSTSVEPSIDNLLKIKVPLYVAHGAKDKAVPIESAYLIPLEFIRKRKNNLTFKVYPKLNHSFAILPTSAKEEYIDKWDVVVTEFLHWCETH